MQIPKLSPRWAPYLFISPCVALFALFGVFPLLFSLYLAFQSWEPTSGLGAMQYVGLENFYFAIGDAWFWKSLGNTLWLALASGLPQHLVAIPLAVFIHQSFTRSRDFMIGAYFLPYITTSVAIAIMFSSLFSRDYGLVNLGLDSLFGMAPIDWLNKPGTIKPACLRTSSTRANTEASPAAKPKRYPARFERFESDCSATTESCDVPHTDGCRTDTGSELQARSK